MRICEPSPITLLTHVHLIYRFSFSLPFEQSGKNWTLFFIQSISFAFIRRQTRDIRFWYILCLKLWCKWMRIMENKTKVKAKSNAIEKIWHRNRMKIRNVKSETEPAPEPVRPKSIYQSKDRNFSSFLNFCSVSFWNSFAIYIFCPFSSVQFIALWSMRWPFVQV